MSDHDVIPIEPDKRGGKPSNIRFVTANRFDPTLIKYDPSRVTVLETVNVQASSLLDLWEQYKEANAHRIAKTTQKHCWHS